MTKDIVIEAERLAKSYLISHEAERSPYRTLSEAIPRLLTGVTRGVGAAMRGQAKVNDREEFWALRDVNFHVRRGDVVGLIGRNGAGKSTLLKILSRITEPTSGKVTINGRVASLLEVGTGFHPELTGRENIFLNGAILGMRKAEIRRKFDEIVEFAEIIRFLDTPVKRYSSGMYVRLAFAVAAHLEPEILIVDEVLAVGDAEFQKKCLGKMSEISGGGRTVLFVSHNLAAIETLCSRAVCIAGGMISQEGTPSEVIAGYIGRRDGPEKNNGFKVGAALELTEIAITPPAPRTDESVVFELPFVARGNGKIMECALLIYSLSGIRVAIIDLREFHCLPFRYNEGRFTFRVRVSRLALVDGDYWIGAYIVTDDFNGDVMEIAELRVLARRFQQGFAPYSASVRGVVSLDVEAATVVHQPFAGEALKN